MSPQPATDNPLNKFKACCFHIEYVTSLASRWTKLTPVSRQLLVNLDGWALQFSHHFVCFTTFRFLKIASDLGHHSTGFDGLIEFHSTAMLAESQRRY